MSTQRKPSPSEIVRTTDLGADERLVIDGSRRRLFRGLTGGAGVLLAVPAKTALGQVICQSPSAMVSGNLSRPAGSSGTCVGGRSPGYWKQPQFFTHWISIGLTPPTFSVQVDTCTTGLAGLKYSDVATPGTMFATIFGSDAGNSPTSGKAPSLWGVLAFPTDWPSGQLMRHLTAAYMNSLAFPDYPIRPAQVISMWNQLRSYGVYCPSGPGTCGAGQALTAQGVIDYISGMYDSGLTDPQMCKKNP